MIFDTLGLTDSLLRAVRKTGYTQPTPIQKRAIPEILEGRDVMAAAQTGTGKTAGFTLPLLQILGDGIKTNNYQVRALVITPTRELAAQIQDSIETYGSNEKLSYGVVFGGVNINPQKQSIKRGLDILVATPGRLLDLYQQRAVRFDALEVLILDEADRMLDMGFIRDIRKILALLPKQRQNLMFSATFSNDIRKLAKTICHNPVEIDVAPRNSTVKAISQKLYKVEKGNKIELLSKLLRDDAGQTLVFSRTKHGANNLAKKLNRENIAATAIHGNKSQGQRTKALDDFKRNKVQVLVATDIAARGIDIDHLATVVNFDLPQVAEDYVHRIGRTGRAGASGQAISLVSSEERKQLRDIERLIKRSIPVEETGSFKLSPVIAAESSQDSDERRQRPDLHRRAKPKRHKPRAKSGKQAAGANRWKSSRSRVAAAN
ncbi:MAG TPA: ATP-dependent RNA helicase RhlE [Gammaproteobacteria bacterium]|jgi:ATP-dependent RNA helicase RhlE|nr:DEAD/DEAH box helicase [Gammaproteobacteria bacterium]MDP6733528.1 DEAD/DEAH box helicase [Gammaproteobacteria bacterium]HAJ75032.1 ATP-dependent RNA helicase RhlE [Gammaproteobacteria bacterium]|tara:strand:- start:976 stop:2274 length:1299 start_codon:yes stop_codon:yes gene_type:complete